MEFERTVLPGGTRVLTEHMAEVRSVALGFWIGVGSRDEPEELAGSCHFLEHLLFKGSKSHTGRLIAELFDSVGGEANAFSAKEYTCLYARILDKDLETAVEVLSDMVRNPLLLPLDVETERNVILEELAMHEDTPEDLVHDIFTETLFGSHPLGREVMGTAETVASITPETLRSFHEGSYHSANIVVAAAGNADHEKLVKWVDSEFGAERHRPLERSSAPDKPSSSSRVISRRTEQAHIVIGGIGYGRDDPRRFAWGVLDNLLGSGSSSRLFQEIRENRGLAYSVFSYRNTFTEIGSWAIYAGTAPRNVPELIEVIDTELDRLITDGITQEELQRAKGCTRGSTVLALEDPASRMTRIGKTELVKGEQLTIDEIIARVDAVTREDVAEVARDLLVPQRRVLSAIGPFSVGELERVEEASRATA
ncbi:MAG: M16 family metallopeptidase [Actinomycetota bacterium]